jgi:hypothetical protein
MANPNIVNVADIRGQSTSLVLTANTDTLLISNPANSNKIFKINTILAANTSTTTAANIIVRRYSGASLGGTAVEFIPEISVPFRAMLVCLDKATSIYLPENTSIGVRSDGSAMKVTASWEEIS